MRLRHASATDRVALAELPIGSDGELWLEEVGEIVSGLLDWRDRRPELDRHVLVLEDDHGAVVAVSAHEAEEDLDGRVFARSRYLLVTAVHAERRRTGLARVVVESVVADIQRNGGEAVSWLVHPGNQPSLAFAHSVFPNIEETYPPEDHPYARFVLIL